MLTNTTMSYESAVDQISVKPEWQGGGTLSGIYLYERRGGNNPQLVNVDRLVYYYG